MSDIPAARKAPAPGSNLARRRPWRIPRTPAPAITESEQAEAARIAETKFRIQIAAANPLTIRATDNPNRFALLATCSWDFKESS
jgi:hypothetical protein